jgi:hypothetical protein
MMVNLINKNLDRGVNYECKYCNINYQQDIYLSIEVAIVKFT